MLLLFPNFRKKCFCFFRKKYQPKQILLTNHNERKIFLKH